MSRARHFKVLRRGKQDNLSGVRVNQSEHFRADGAEPIVNNLMKVVGSTKENGQFGFGQVEAKELAADVIIEAGAASRVGTLSNHFRPFPSPDHWDGNFNDTSAHGRSGAYAFFAPMYMAAISATAEQTKHRTITTRLRCSSSCPNGRTARYRAT